jgi:hypothetical protein
MPLTWRDELKEDDPLFQQGVSFLFKAPQTPSTNSSSESTAQQQQQQQQQQDEDVTGTGPAFPE